MLKIETTFASHSLEAVIEAVFSLPGPRQVSASQVLFADRVTSRTQQYRGSTYTVPWQPRTQLEMWMKTTQRTCFTRFSSSSTRTASPRGSCG